MRRALVDLIIQGVETSREFHIRVMDDTDFRTGEIDIQWLERHLAEISKRSQAPESARIASIAAALLAERDRTARSVPGDVAAPGSSSSTSVSTTGWKQAARVEGLRG